MKAQPAIPTILRRLRDAASDLAGVARRFARVVAAVPIAAAALPASTASAQVVVPFSTNVAFANTSQVATYVVDLGSLPLRPELVVEATPDGAHANLQLQLEITDFQIDPESSAGSEFCLEPTAVVRSLSGPGVAQVAWAAWTCKAEPGALAGDSVRVNVRVLSFGTGGAPANVAIQIRGVTTIPTSTQLVPYRVPGQTYSATLSPTKDATIYERNGAGSDGAGQFLWAGRDVETASPFTPHPIRSLVSFNLRSGFVPLNATVTNVELRLDVESIVGTGNSLSVYGMEYGRRWSEGDADAAGSEFQSATSQNVAATWTHRRFPLTDFEDEWSSGGGDPFDLLASQAISSTGIKSFSSSALQDYVVDFMLQDGSVNSRADGFVLRGPETSAASSGVQLASREATAAGANRPALVVTFIQPAGPQDGADQAGVVTYINEGQNLRWIYDLDHDDVYVTPVGGVCTVTSPIPGSGTMSYTYAFGGTPGFTGHDCCTWHLDSESGTLGTGQLLFFHNLDATNPANMPPDSDADGIRNLCDNCPFKPNGPLLGSCLTGPLVGSSCRSNQACGAGGTCSLSQEDADGDKQGDACVPEPDGGTMLVAGALAVIGLARRRLEAKRAA